MTFNEFENTMNAFKQAVLDEGLAINASVSLGALSLIKSRILNDGIGANGSSLGDYSNNPLPSYYFIGKGLVGGSDEGVRKANKKNKGKGVSYSEFRSINNLQTNHIDLKFSGAMWSDMQITDASGSNGLFTTVVGSSGSKTYPGGINTEKVTEFLADKYGDFLTLSKKEEDIISKSLDDEIQNLIDRYFS